MTKEDYKRLSTMIQMYCMPDLPGSYLPIPNATTEQKTEQDLDNEKLRVYYRGELNMYNRIIKWVKEKPQWDELVFNILTNNDKS